MKCLRARIAIVCSLSALQLASCGWFGGKMGENAGARAEVEGFMPNTVRGTVYFTQDLEKGLRITGEISGLLPDQSYAMHIAQNGNCGNPKAPGDDFDPGKSGKHGATGLSPGQAHAGDLPNIKAGGNGKAKIDITTNALGIGKSDYSVLERSVVIYANPDDFSTQPQGNVGEAIACGVIQSTR